MTSEDYSLSFCMSVSHSLQTWFSRLFVMVDLRVAMYLYNDYRSSLSFVKIGQQMIQNSFKRLPVFIKSDLSFKKISNTIKHIYDIPFKDRDADKGHVLLMQ